jgi:hypothetical protein
VAAPKKKLVSTGIRGGGRPSPTAPPTIATFQTIPAPGGSYHVYPNGKKVFVKAGQAPPAAEAVAALPDQSPTDAASAAAPTPWVPDAAYYETVAAAQQRRDQLMAENQATGERNATTRTAALQSLSAQQPRDTQTLQESRNKQGLYYSGRLGQDMSDLAASYATKRSGVETSFADAERQRLSQQNALQADFANTEREARYGSVSRAVTADTQAADAGILAPTTVTQDPTVAAATNIAAAPKAPARRKIVPRRPTAAQRRFWYAPR